MAEKNHRHSVNNPYAQFQDEYSLEQILSSKQVCDPLTVRTACDMHVTCMCDSFGIGCGGMCFMLLADDMHVTNMHACTHVRMYTCRTCAMVHVAIMGGVPK